MTCFKRPSRHLSPPPQRRPMAGPPPRGTERRLVPAAAAAAPRPLAAGGGPPRARWLRSRLRRFCTLGGSRRTHWPTTSSKMRTSFSCRALRACIALDSARRCASASSTSVVHARSRRAASLGWRRRLCGACSQAWCAATSPAWCADAPQQSSTPRWTQASIWPMQCRRWIPIAPRTAVRAARLWGTTQRTAVAAREEEARPQWTVAAPRLVAATAALMALRAAGRMRWH
mmetsp:Transcript_1378/g.5477  ORF Transcript_1378/g.5477 Transcript_1378/m.5477 type:complete len:230 (+) Transcript_1378:897-1586(+)